MKQIIILITLLFLCSCTKEIKQNHDSVFKYLLKQKNILEFGDFFVVQRSESDSYLYRNNDFNVEYWFTINTDINNPFEYYDEGKNKSDNYLKINFPKDFIKIKSVINKTLNFSSILFQKFDLKAINGWLDKGGKVELEFSFKDNTALCYFQERNSESLGNEKIIKRYDENWVLVKD
ncbi:MAG: hypothetical protein Q8M94_04665 [Ignavibacteria bacterium]|nr:hypothetical protein [Ignavibacteria bacterium]